MKKRIALVSIGLFFIATFANAGVYLKYSNKDSKNYTFKVKVSGSSSKAEFKSSTTGAYTIKGGSGKAVISCECGEVEVEDGDKITIKNGCITVE